MNNQKKTKIETIDVTPTWGEIGNLLKQTSGLNENMLGEIQRALCMAQAYTEIKGDLSVELAEKASAVIEREALKQGLV